MPQKRSEKQIFQDVRLAVTCSLGGQWTDANISRWLSRRGGVYTPAVDEQTTHLICTVEEYKAKSLIVKQAAKLGVKQCKIVTLDWLEDSLFRDKKLPVKDYALSAVLKNERAQESQAAKVAKGNELAERFVNTNLYHVYADASNFFYEIILTRDDTEAGWQGQKYILYLFESNAKPHLYQFAAKFYQKPRDSQPKYYRPSETPQPFWTEYDKFKSFFLKKTGIEWDERLVQISLDESLFQYKAPTGGKPVGYVPPSGQRKPSSLSAPNKTHSEVKTEPEEKDVQFSAAIERLAAAQTDADPGPEYPAKPLMNDQTLAVAINLEGLVKQGAEDVDMAVGRGGWVTMTAEDVKQTGFEAVVKRTGPEDAHPSAAATEVAKEAAQDEQMVDAADMDIDQRANITTAPAETSPYFMH